MRIIITQEGRYEERDHVVGVNDRWCATVGGERLPSVYGSYREAQQAQHAAIIASLSGGNTK